MPRELSKWAALLRPYQLNVWISLIVIFMLSGPVGCMIFIYDAKADAKPMTIARCYEILLKMILSQGNTVGI